MKNFYQLVKTTLIGGLIFLVPVIVLIIVFGKAFKLMMLVAKPLSAWIPMDSIGGVALADMLAILAVFLCCLMAGILAKSHLAKRGSQALEAKLLTIIPMYSFIKGVTDSITNSEEASKSLIPVLAQFDDNAQVGFEIERIENGRVVVFLPGSPNPWSGSVAYFDEDRIQRIDVTAAEAINNIRHLGRGSGSYKECLENSR